VSTRGRGSLAYEQEWPGLPGKYNVIQAGFRLNNIDFVEEPSVSETEDDVQVENKKEKPMKTLEELKKEFPEIFAALEQKHSEEISSLKKAIEEATSLTVKSNDSLKSLVESIKTISPESFVMIPESKIVEAKDASLKQLTDEVTSLKSELENSKNALTVIESEKAKVEKEKTIETLKAENPSYVEYFKQEKIVKMYEACTNSEEVRTVFENHKSIMDLGAKKDNTPAAPKTQTPETKSNDLSESQAKHMKFVNEQRLCSGMPSYTKEQYLEKYK
jgi:hypothetical protein